MATDMYKPGKGISVSTYEKAQQLARHCADVWRAPAYILLSGRRYRIVRYYDIGPRAKIVDNIGPKAVK